jgi:hypothetical protein
MAMWEMEGFSHMRAQDFLDNIAQFYRQEEECAAIPLAGVAPAPAPVEIRPGYFSVDLTEVMAHRASLNSQQVLLPFFQNTKFDELEILCEHVPKWLARELPGLKLKTEEKIAANKIRIKVFPV